MEVLWRGKTALHVITEVCKVTKLRQIKWGGGLCDLLIGTLVQRFRKGALVMALMTASGGLSNSKLALANAGTEDVLSGKTYYAGDKNLKTGDMPNNGAWSSSVGQGESITIPKGYHNGMGKVSAKTQKKVFLGYAGTSSNAWSSLTYNVKNNYPSIYSKLTRANFYACTI